MPSRITTLQFQRVVDANYNRSKEGLRVCEDICRFVRNDHQATARFKKLRHDLTRAIAVFGSKDIVAARDIIGDVGRGSIGPELRRKNVADIFYANAQRVKESLRVLEEFSKLKSASASGAFKRLRYAVYDIEKKVLGWM